MKPGAWIKLHGTEIAELWQEGNTTSHELSAKYGATRSAIMAWICRMGYRKGSQIITSANSVRRLSNMPFDGADVCNLDHDVKALAPLLHSKTALVNALAARCGLTTAELLAPRRGRKAAHKQWRAAYLLRQSGLSYPRIGRLLNKDHTSAMYGIKRFKACIDAAKQMAAE